jgi:hypothetical protein
MADEETKVVTTEETTEPIDPTSLLMGYRVGQMIRGMRKQQKEDV